MDTKTSKFNNFTDKPLFSFFNILFIFTAVIGLGLLVSQGINLDVFEPSKFFAFLLIFSSTVVVLYNWIARKYKEPTKMDFFSLFNYLAAVIFFACVG